MQGKIIFVAVLVFSTALATLTQDVVHVSFNALRAWITTSANPNG
jgi:hypothetical protein